MVVVASRLRIEFVDGTGQVVDYAETVKIQDGVLIAYNTSSIMGVVEHVGSWPLVNIRTWKVETR